MTDNNGCTFCSRKDIEEGLLFQTDNFFIRAAVKGAMAPGHVLLISKEHLSCYGVMPKSLDAEYAEAVERARDKVNSYFSLPFSIEQGIHGQSIKHAHLHLVPLVSPWYDFTGIRLIDYVPKGIRVEDGRDINDLRRVFREDGQYVAIGQNETLSICRTRNYDGTFRSLRGIATEITGRRDLFDWRNVAPEVAEENQRWVRETIDKLREK